MAPAEACTVHDDYVEDVRYVTTCFQDFQGGLSRIQETLTFKGFTNSNSDFFILLSESLASMPSESFGRKEFNEHWTGHEVGNCGVSVADSVLEVSGKGTSQVPGGLLRTIRETLRNDE